MSVLRGVPKFDMILTATFINGTVTLILLHKKGNGEVE